MRHTPSSSAHPSIVAHRAQGLDHHRTFHHALLGAELSKMPSGAAIPSCVASMPRSAKKERRQSIERLHNCAALLIAIISVEHYFI
jgi:hypothetical protein